MILLCQLVHLDALLLGPANFELRFTIYLVSKKTIVNSFVMFFLSVNSFATSLPRVEGEKVLLLCFSFTVPSTMGSLLLDHEVRDRESIQFQFAKLLAGFALNQEVSTSAMDYSLIFNREGILSIALSELFRRARITLHCPFHESSLSIRH